MSLLKNTVIALGADHGGFALKEDIKKFLGERGYTIIDCGTNSTDAVDYPVFAGAVAKKVSSGEAKIGIIVDGAGIGSAMVANKVKNVRAANCYDLSTATNAREHNNANVLTLGSGLIGPSLARQIVSRFLSVECSEERHLRRAGMIDKFDSSELPTFAADIQKSAPETPAIQPTTGENVSEMSTDDLQKITVRVMELLNGANPVDPDCQGTCGTGELCDNCGKCAIRNTTRVKQLINLGASRISLAPGNAGVEKDIAAYIDHTILKPEATSAEIVQLCAEAREYGFASVCVNPTFVALAKRELQGSDVLVCTVVGFPLGTHMHDIKAAETRRAIRDGAREIDMVINIGALKAGDHDLVFKDIRSVVEACEDGSAHSKVIIETALLTDDEKRTACELAKRARADFVKTSTGFSKGGATEHDIALMSDVVAASGMGVKASGGIKSFEDAEHMIAAGATRLGASAGVKIVKASAAATMSN
jgi:deoxyribose-phosphate aldolase